MRKMKPGNEYFIINVDESYAHLIYEILKYGQTIKGEWSEGDITFDEWKNQTFGKSRKQADDMRKAERRLKELRDKAKALGLNKDGMCQIKN